MSISRRNLFKVGLGTAGLYLAGKDPESFAIDAGLEDQGVASGSPTPEGFVIWTRIPEQYRQGQGSCEVSFDISESPLFEAGSIVQSGHVMANADRDFTVRPKIQGLKSDAVYYYRFICGAYKSIIGRAKTFPVEGSQVSEISFGIISCQKFSDGFYTALAGLNSEEVFHCIHLGDHIYEQETGKIRIDSDPLQGKPAESLTDYRAKYRHYLSDPDYREARRKYTWIDLIDDHEVFNDYAGKRDRSLQRVRVAAAYQAYAEYTPLDADLSFDDRGLPELRTREKIGVGSLIDFFRIDQRQFRLPNPCSRAFVTKRCAEAEVDTHSMLGDDQLGWLKEELGSSNARWKILLSEVMFTPLTVKVFGSEFLDQLHTSPELLDSIHGKLNSSASNSTYLNLDAWDGYPAERERLLDFIAQEQISNVVALTGDIHAGVHAKVLRNGQPATAKPTFYEIVTTSVTSTTLGEKLGPLFGTMAGALIAKSNPHVEWSNIYSHGYSVVTITPNDLKVRQMAVSTVTSNTASLTVSKVFYLKNGFNI